MFFPFRNLFLRPIVSRIAARVTHKSIRFQLQQSRSSPAASSSGGLKGSLVDNFDIITIDGPTWNSVSGRAVTHSFYFHHLADWSGCTIFIVLANKDHRQIPNRGHVNGFMEAPDVGGAISEKAGYDIW